MIKDWQKELAEVGYTNEMMEQEFEKLHQIEMERSVIHNKYNKYLEPFNKKVLDRPGPKTIVKYPTPKFLLDKYPPYSFKAVCLVTGEPSNLIKMDDYYKYGILPEHTKDASSYKTFDEIKKHLVNKLEGFRSSYLNELNQCYDKINEVQCDIRNISEELRQQWFEKYDKYLNTENWFDKRNHIMGLDSYQCLLTGSKDNLQVHHIIYDTVGIEDSDHCITLSREAHQRIHSVSFQERRELEYKCLKKRLGSYMNEYNPNNVKLWFN